MKNNTVTINIAHVRCFDRYDRNNNPFFDVVRGNSYKRKNSSDIPLALRSSPIRRPTKKEIRLISLVSLFVVLCVVFALSLFFNFFQIGPSRLVDLPPPSSDGRLLGHYRYPEAPPEDLIDVYPGLSIHKDTYNALREMRSAALADGVSLTLLSGYRSIDLQEEIFYGNKSARNQIAIERAKVSAPPGYSEHSTGYAIDLGDAGYRNTDLEVQFENTPAFKWLNKNAAKYHFILSFPRGNPQKVSYEPWHWRFEGTVEALRLFESANEIRRN